MNNIKEFDNISCQNQTFILWKWSDETLTGDIRKKVEDLCSRFHAGTVFVAVHWVHKRFDDIVLLSKINECCKELHNRGRKMCIEACVRNEGEGFFDSYPKDKAYLAHFEEILLDGNGFGEIGIAVEPVYHYWRVSGTKGAEKIFGAWFFNKCDCKNALYRDGSLIRHDDAASIICEEYNSKIKSKLVINAGKEYAGKTALVCLGTPQPIPDLASENLYKYYRHMIESIKPFNIDGVFSDEWGYDVILKIKETNPYDDNSLLLRHFSISDSFAGIYSEKFPGSCLFDDLPHLCYASEFDNKSRIIAINQYIKTLRETMAENEKVMYSIVKDILGADTFYGIHPTWWGSVDNLNFEIFKNGFYWWEAKRDIAQTDEMIAMPIRTALAHKWDSEIWYNMWYSLGTRDINTYFKEGWTNLRYGGRTHYHGYECPNEPVVLELCQPGLLEALEQMDSRIRMLDGIQTTQPDSRVLILFGFEAATNWALAGNPLSPWTTKNLKLDKVLNTANNIFYKILCDLVPSTEIENGSVFVNDGKAYYNRHSYDAVVLLYPEAMSKACYGMLKNLDYSCLIVCGSANYYNDMTPIEAEDAKILKSAKRVYEDVPSADELAEELKKMNVAENIFKNGCILADGSAIFTAEGKLPKGNPLEVNAIIGNLQIHFKGEDFLYIKYNSNKPYTIYPGEGILAISELK